ncbi:lysozyme inhibitor LprI family protein [Jannaschia ovalis]|uniref:DUF1311 domain-containing protein n=1 Tax=Jannaschia ovalis TaxID=3038773 RepID=A0ABY8L8N6_9RHOB|nr:DUF1311 domain-containing protein [Jannaschia sp. GRR-S6-38]WGH77629.1 DUF1311 domain-containing protein [Jannaschia sp. GRR-S6-38]
MTGQPALRGLLCGLLLGLAAPAGAQNLDPAPWRGGFDACVAGAADATALIACKGLAARACMDGAEGGMTQLGMTECTAMEGALWDELLNADWPRHRDWARAADATEAEIFGDAFSDRADALLAAQRAWIAFRDAQCRLEYAAWGSGSMRSLAAASCVGDMTAERVIVLRQMTEGM